MPSDLDVPLLMVNNNQSQMPVSKIGKTCESLRAGFLIGEGGGPGRPIQGPEDEASLIGSTAQRVEGFASTRR